MQDATLLSQLPKLMQIPSFKDSVAVSTWKMRGRWNSKQGCDVIREYEKMEVARTRLTLVRRIILTVNTLALTGIVLTLMHRAFIPAFYILSVWIIFRMLVRIFVIGFKTDISIHRERLGLFAEWYEEITEAAGIGATYLAQITEMYDLKQIIHRRFLTMSLNAICLQTQARNVMGSRTRIDMVKPSVDMATEAFTHFLHCYETLSTAYFTTYASADYLDDNPDNATA